MKTTVIPNFLTDEEIFDLEKNFRLKQDTVIWKEPTEVANVSHAMYWYPGPSYKEEVCNYLTNKVNVHFPNNVCDNWHILHAYKPYGIHTDSLDDEIVGSDHTHGLPNGFKFGWTFLIPLDNYNANTIVFNEGTDKMKVSTKWIQSENKAPQGLISDDIHQEYLTHQGKDLVDYFSIETIFPWNKGDLLIMPRRSFHCSDNFVVRNLLEKRALIGWSLIPI